MATIDGIGRAWWVAVAGKMVRCLAAGGSRIRTRGPTTKRKAMGNDPSKHRRLGPGPVSGFAFRVAVSNWQRPEEPFAGAGPMVRLRLPPARSLLQT